MGPDGGTIAAGNVKLVLAPGAVSAPTKIDIKPAAGPAYLDTPAIQVFTIVATDDGSGNQLGSFREAALVAVTTAGLDLNGADPMNLRLARLLGSTWTLVDSSASGTSVMAMIDAPGTYGVVEISVPARVTVTQVSNAPDAGRHRIDPGSTLTLTLTLTPETKLRSGTLVEELPTGWAVVDAGGGTYESVAGTVTWQLPVTKAGATIVRTLDVSAPRVSPDDGGPAFTATFKASVQQPPADRTTTDDITVLVAPAIVMEHFVFGQVGGSGGQATYLAPDTTLRDQPVFDVFRIRFRLENVDSVPASLGAALLVYRSTDAPDGGWAMVPPPESGGSAAFRASSESIDLSTGTPQLGPGDAQLGTASSRDLPFRGGYRSEGLNPGPGITIDGDSAVEVEFSVSPTVFAAYLRGYEFRLTDAGSTIGVPAQDSAASGLLATVVIGPEPAPDLSPGQKSGAPVGEVRFALRAPSASFLGPAAPTAPGGVSPHGDSSLSTDSCAACHRTHTAQGANLLVSGSTQSQLCFTCHDGLGAASGPSHQWAIATPNDPATASYYQHPATAVSTHTAEGEEFKATFNRHSQCTDCHNPHFPADTTQKSTLTPLGWTASGALQGVTAVGVANPPAPSTDPVYSFLREDPSGTDQPITYEYQLCLKCHSGYTDLSGLPNSPANDPTHPSRWALDKGVEFNPNNLGVASYHPIEQPGTNGSSAMNGSLHGDSPSKLWQFDSDQTVRCTQCHADSAITPAKPAAGARLDLHASANRGLLLGAYRDRQLHLRDDKYVADEFELCYLCHAEAPFVTASKDPRGDTNFPLHGVHIKYLQGKGGTSTDTDIDAPEAGAGNAICAECHYRIHSTANRVGAQDAYTGLVNFAPSVTDVVVNSWEKTATGGSCALTCHGKTHTGGPDGNSTYVSVAGP